MNKECAICLSLGDICVTCEELQAVPAGFASGRDEDNAVLLDKRDLFDAVRGAIKEAMLESGSYADEAEVFGLATDAANEALRDLVSKGAVPPAGYMEVLAFLDPQGDAMDAESGAIFAAKYPNYTALVGLSHVTRLQSVNAALQALLTVADQRVDDLQGELTKARELLDRWLNMFEGGLKSGDLDSLWNDTADYVDPTYNQSAPAAKGGE